MNYLRTPWDWLTATVAVVGVGVLFVVGLTLSIVHSVYLCSQGEDGFLRRGE